jgi:hypothetical protein
MREKLHQVRSAIWLNLREIAHSILEVVAKADSLYSSVIFS